MWVRSAVSNPMRWIRERLGSGDCRPSAEVARWMAADGILDEIHAEDFIFKYVRTNSRQTGANSADLYFEDGRQSASKLEEVLAQLGVELAGVDRLLEFASGYGMVTRHLVKRLDPAHITSCDIHPQALAFLEQNLAINTLLSQTDPADFSCPEEYDVVFALSFFSHMPQRTWGPWLKVLFDNVKAGGLLVFTTHGETSAGRWDMEIPASGFLFRTISEQHDLDTDEYGATATTPAFVRAEVERQTGGAALVEKLAYWWEHQDLYVVQK